MKNSDQKFCKLDAREPYEYASYAERSLSPVTGVFLVAAGVFWSIISCVAFADVLSGMDGYDKGTLYFALPFLSLFVLLGVGITAFGVYNIAGHFVKTANNNKLKLNGLVTAAAITSSAIEKKYTRGSKRGGGSGYPYYIIKAEYTFTDNNGTVRTGRAQRRTLVLPPEYQSGQEIAVLFDGKRSVQLLKYTVDGQPTKNDASLYNENFRLGSEEAQALAEDAAKELGKYLSGQTFYADESRPVVPRAYAGTVRVIGGVVAALGAGVIVLMLFLSGLINFFLPNKTVQTDQILRYLGPAIMGFLAGGAFLFAGARIIFTSSRQVYESKKTARSAYFTDAVIYNKKNGPSTSGFMYFYRDWQGAVRFGFEPTSVFFSAPLFSFTQNYTDNFKVISGADEPQKPEAAHETYDFCFAVCAYNDDGKSVLIHKCALKRK